MEWSRGSMVRPDLARLGKEGLLLLALPPTTVDCKEPVAQPEQCGG